MILKVFRNEFYKWAYTKFSKLDKHIKIAFNETFIEFNRIFLKFL